MNGKLALGLVAALSLALLIAILAFDLSPTRLIAPSPTPEQAAAEVEAMLEGSADPEIDAYLRALKAQFPQDYAALSDALRKRALAGDDAATLAATANAEALRIARGNLKFAPYAPAGDMAVFFDNQARVLEFARDAYGPEACVEAARHGGQAVNARILREPPESPLLQAALHELIASHRAMLTVMKAGKDAGPRELPAPSTEDWRALAQAIRNQGAEKAHFDALSDAAGADDETLCAAAIFKAKGLATLEGAAAEVIRPHVAKSMVGE